MYAIANVERFLNDNAGRISRQKRVAVMKRARAQGGANGILMGGRAKDLWRDDALEEEFNRIITTDPVHMEMGVTAIRASKH